MTKRPQPPMHSSDAEWNKWHHDMNARYTLRIVLWILAVAVLLCVIIQVGG